MEYATTPVDRVLASLGSRPEGLDEAEVQERRSRYGPNELEARSISVWTLFFRQFRSPLVLLLVVAAVVSAGLKQFVDAVTIVVILLINGILGFVQEHQSERSLAKLREYVKTTCRVRRDGRIRTIDRRELVPGDVILLTPGSIVPSDSRVVSAEKLSVDESVLTGESFPVGKSLAVMAHPPSDRLRSENLLFEGTTVMTGEAEAVVVATGQQTELGKIAKTTAETERRSSFEESMANFAKFLLRLVLITLAVVFVANLIVKRGVQGPGELLLFSIAMAVSVIPEALPVVTTITLSRGALTLAKRKVVAKRLSAIEDLGRIEVLCTDKTGTVTENRLTVEALASERPEELLRLALAGIAVGEGEELPTDVFERALWEYASPPVRDAAARSRVKEEIPFDPTRRRTTDLVEDGRRRFIVSKGAPEVVLERCATILGSAGPEPLDHRKGEVEAEFRHLGSRGSRVIAVATGSAPSGNDLEAGETDMTFVGMVAFRDPLKATAKAAIQRAEHLNVRVKILTGDSVDVATTVGKELGIIEGDQDVISASDLTKLSANAFDTAVEKYDVFARVTPEEKYRIIQALQEHYAVGFLGEGINDAPALKLANVGLVVDNASDVAKEASDVVLLEKDLDVVVTGIGEGRKIFSNIGKYIKYTLIGNFGNFYAIAGISLLIPFLPMLPVQILLTNLLTDLPLVAIAADSVDPEELKRPKRALVREIMFVAVTLGLVSSFFDFIFFGIFHTSPAATLQTLWFVESILTELILIFSIRTMRSAFRAVRPSWTLVGFTGLAAIITVILPFTGWGQSVFHFVRPKLGSLAVVFGIVAAYFFATEFAKRLYYRLLHSHLEKRTAHIRA